MMTVKWRAKLGAASTRGETGNKNIESTFWENCAREHELNSYVIRECQYGEGKELLAENIRIAKSLGIQASLTFLWENCVKITGLKNLLRYKKIYGC